MTFNDIFNTAFEFILFGGLVWCIFNEHRLIAFERKIKAYFRRKTFKVVKAESKVLNSSHF